MGETAKTVLEDCVRLHFGIACLELLGEPLIPYQLTEELMISEQHVYRVSPASGYTGPKLTGKLWKSRP